MEWNSLSSKQQKTLASFLASSCDSSEIDYAVARSLAPGDTLRKLVAPYLNMPQEHRFRARLNDLVMIAVRKGTLSAFIDAIRVKKLGEVAFRNLRDIIAVADAPVTISGQPGFEFQGAANKLGIVDFEALLLRMAEIREATCRFVVSDGPARYSSLGSGVLVGDDLVLTNHHVLDRYMIQTFAGETAAPPTTLTCEFDFTGAKPSGMRVPLAPRPDWLVAVSARNAAAALDGGEALTIDRLDYALVRLAARPLLASGGQRKFETPLNVTKVENGQPILVVHYPGQDPLGASFGKTVGMQVGDVQIRYDADTEKGSSGSGVYRLPDCSLICLHQGADRAAGYNQGIPMARILAHRHQK